jgi:hypothetical protein
MKRPARPPADVIRGRLFAAAPFVELEDAAVPAAVLVPAELPVRINRLGIPIVTTDDVHPYQMI